MTDLGPLKRGDARTITLWTTRPDGSRETLADKRVWFTAKRSRADADEAAVIRKGTANTGLDGITITVPATGQPGEGGDAAVVAIAPADTAGLPDYDVRLRWDAQLAAAGGDPQTPDAWSGMLTVQADVTRAA